MKLRNRNEHQKSLPLRKCGLKSRCRMLLTISLRHFPCGSVDWNCWSVFKEIMIAVTSLAEVWIEIQLLKDDACTVPSLPLRKCGLKCMQRQLHRQSRSHFPCGSVDWNFNQCLHLFYHCLSLPLRKCGLKLNWPQILHFGICHFPCGSVDWNIILFVVISGFPRHFPCGSVDWNIQKLKILNYSFVTSLAEVWIEIWYLWLYVHGLPRHFPCGSVDWNRCISGDNPVMYVTSLAEVWIEIISATMSTMSLSVTSLAEVWIEIVCI